MHPWKMNLWRVKEIPKFSHSKNCGDFTFIDRNFATRVDRFDFWDSGRHPRKKKRKWVIYVLTLSGNFRYT